MSAAADALFVVVGVLFLGLVFGFGAGLGVYALHRAWEWWERKPEREPSR